MIVMDEASMVSNPDLAERLAVLAPPLEPSRGNADAHLRHGEAARTRCRDGMPIDGEALHKRYT
jgi:hypothetical protein